MTRITILLIFLSFVFFGGVINAQEIKSWQFKDNKNKPFLKFSFYVDSSRMGDKIELNKDLSKQIQDIKSINLLVKYFKLAKKQETKLMASMFFIDDGSRSRFLETLKKSPKKYKAYKDIDQIIIDEIVYWGEYQAVNLRLFSQGKLLSPFTQLLYCTKSECKLSDRIFHQDDNFSFLSSLFSLVPKSKEVALKKPLPNQILNNKNRNFPIGIDFNLDYLQKKVIVKKENKPKKIISSEYSVIEEFVRSIWGLDKNNDQKFDLNEVETEGLQGSQRVKIYSNKIINGVFKANWEHSFETNLIPNYKTVSVKGNLWEIVNTNYTNFSLSQLILKWKEFSVVAKQSISGHKYVWVTFKTHDKAANDGLLLFVINTENNKLSSDVSTIDSILLNNLVINVMTSSMLLKVK